MSEYQNKIIKAEKILYELKEELFHIITDTKVNEYCSNRLLLPWLEEDMEYSIKKLKLNKKDENKYIRKIHNIFGVYSEDIPSLKKLKEKNNQNQ